MKKINLVNCLITVIISYFFSFAPADAQPPTISYQTIISGLSAPVDIVNAGDGSNRLFIVQQGGVIKVSNVTSVSDFIDLSTLISTGGERGLLSMAFHPKFNGTTNRYF